MEVPEVLIWSQDFTSEGKGNILKRTKVSQK